MRHAEIMVTINDLFLERQSHPLIKFAILSSHSTTYILFCICIHLLDFFAFTDTIIARRGIKGAGVAGGGAPPEVEDGGSPQQFHRAREGQILKLRCPISGTQPFKVVWSKVRKVALSELSSKCLIRPYAF